MTVFTFEEGETGNPLGRTSWDEVGRLPFGAAEIDRDGRVVAFNDTEPDDGVQARPPMVGRDFFQEVMPCAGNSCIVEEFRKGVISGDLNVVFDCNVARLPYKVRIHLKISPILGTYWVFVKKLARKAT